MAVTSGTRLGPYEILAPIGAGGMGEVYRARDTRLDRTVAVKMLPAEFAGDAQFQIRFEREAKVISQLHHPNICTLFDVGQNYLVMELLEGETLADRLRRGPLPVPEAVRIAVQIAAALESAHRAGIIHRDLKPGNVMLTSTGVKLLDFGLAKPMARADADSQTLQKSLTERGMVVGTLQYMSPEQLEGREVDPRSDLFALGSILYEMLSGRRAFEATGRVSLIPQILGGDPPPLQSIRPAISDSLERIVARCLMKDPAVRWQCAGDLRHELELTSEPRQIAEPSRSRVRFAALLAVVFAVLAIAEGAWLFLHREQPQTAMGPVRFAIDPPPNSMIRMENDTGPPMLSHDGQAVVFIASDILTGRRSLWVRELGSVESRRIAGTEGAMFPFWSPDRKAIGFFADGKLKRIDLPDGAPEPLAEASWGRGGAWGADGQIVYSPSPSEGLYQVSERGGPARRVSVLDTKAGEVSHRWPSLLPDGRHALALVRKPSTAGRSGDSIFVFDVRTGEKKFLTGASSGAVYVDPGRVLYIRGRTLYAQDFDPKTLTLRGEARPLVQKVQFHPSGFGMFSASAGVVCYQTGSLLSELHMVDRQGKILATYGDPAEYTAPALDVARDQFLISIPDPATDNQDVWHYDMKRRVRRRLTFNPSDDLDPIFSPDGKQVMFASNRSGFPQLYLKTIDGSEDEHLILSDPRFARFPGSWSSDGRFVAVNEISTTTQRDVDILDLKEHKTLPFLNSEFNEGGAAFSPSGRWIAYSSDESGRPEVYVTTFPDHSVRWQISSEGGLQPKWRGDEKEIYYFSADSHLMAVPVQMLPAFRAGDPKALFPCELRAFLVDVDEYDVTPDGQRFLINTTTGHPRSLPLTVATGWQP